MTTRHRPHVAGAVAGLMLAALVPLWADQSDPVGVRLADSRQLEAAEIDQTLSAVRRVVGGKPFRFVAEQSDFAADVLFERDGHVRFIRTRVNDSIHFTEYTGRIARYCGGAIADGELVIEYREAGAAWTVSARQASHSDLLRPVFDMLVGLKPMIDEGLTTDRARVLSVDWNLNAGTSPRARRGGGGAGGSAFALSDPTVSGVERLTIDPRLLRPVRWEFAFSDADPRASRGTTLSYRFDYDTDLMLEPPRTGVDPPACVEIGSPF